MGRKKLLQNGEVLDAINRWLVEHGMPPTVEELRRALKLGSVRTVLRYLRDLEASGQIKRWPGARGLRPLRTLQKGLQTIAVPIVGGAPAGPLMIAEQNVEGWVRLPKESLKPQDAKFFLLRVRGDSMNKAAIAGERVESGDLVLVRQRSTADTGDIVVALIDGEATIKRLERGPGYFVLRPDSSNPKHHSIIVTSDFSVQGVASRVFKKGAEILAVEE